MNITMYGFQNILTRCIEILNGKINPNFLCYRYDFVTFESAIAAGECNGFITFYLQKIAEDYTDYDYPDIVSFMILIVSHELSHIEQDINYSRYSSDKEYRNWIEKVNQNHTKQWLYNNMEYLHSVLGEFNDNIIIESCEVTSPGLMEFNQASITQLVRNIVSDYFLNQENEANFFKFDYITMEFFDDDSGNEFDAIIIKEGNSVADPNLLVKHLDIIKRYRSLKLENKKKDGWFNIEIHLTNSNKVPLQIAHVIREI